MAQKEKIQYIRYYAAGSAARKLERQPQIHEHAAPVQVPQKRIPIVIDPVAVIGTVVALALLVCMLVGVAQLNAVNEQVLEMQQTIASLEAEQKQLRSEYEAGYDLEEIRAQAAAMGMVDSTQVEHITITLPEEEVPETMTWWETIVEEILGLFA